MKQTTINIYHEKIGNVFSLSNTDEVQTKLILKLVNDAIGYEETFKYFNVTDTLVHIPYNILKESVLTTVPVMNPHAPAPQTGRQTPVEIPGVMYQTRELFQPVVAIPPQDKK